MCKPQLALFLMVLGILGLILVASGVKIASTQSPALELIESDDGRVQREGAWTLQATPLASGGSYLYSSGAATDALTLHFAGTTVTVVYVAHPTFGILALEIDGTLVRTVDTYDKNTAFGVQTTVDYLQPGSHTLRVSAASGTIALDAFYAEPIFHLFYHDDFQNTTPWYRVDAPLAPSTEATLTLSGATRLAQLM